MNLHPELRIYKYKTIDVPSGSGVIIDDIANEWAGKGWRVVNLIAYSLPVFGGGHLLMLERPIGITHPND